MADSKQFAVSPEDATSKGDYEVEKGTHPHSIVGAEVVERPLSVGVNQAKWYHLGFHQCTAVAGPALLGLPYAMSLLGWPAGVIMILLGFFVTGYSSYIVASLHEFDGVRHIRYRDLVTATLGPTFGRYILWPCQWANLIGVIISIYIQAGLSFQAMAQLASPGYDGLKLWGWIAIIGAVSILFSQMPTFHSLRFGNGFNMCLTYTYSIMGIAIAIYQGHKYSGQPGTANSDYGVHTPLTDKVFGFFNGITIMSFAYGNTIIPEIQATAKSPSEVACYKSLGMLYTQLAFTYIPVAMAGYWAYGYSLNADAGSFLPIYFVSVGGPKWAIYMINVAVILPAIIEVQLYNAPVMEWVETKVYVSKDGVWNKKNWLLRTAIRSFWLAVLCLIAAMFPYWGDILGLIGSLGITPVDFIIPMLMHIKIRKPRGILLVIDVLIITVYTCIGILGCIAAVRGITIDSVNYSLFPNLGYVSPS